MGAEIHPFWLVVVSGSLALLPILLGVCTSYIKISIVFGMLKSGLGTQQVPGSLVVMILSLSMTFFIMAPVFNEISKRAPDFTQAVFQQEPSFEVFSEMREVLSPLAQFMRLHSGKREMESLVKLTKNTESEHAQSSFQILLPAFVLTELKEAFSMGFILLLPFLAVDLIVANILVGLGMFMVSPVMIALPLKLLLFVLADGWLLLSQGLIRSYGV